MTTITGYFTVPLRPVQAQQDRSPLLGSDGPQSAQFSFNGFDPRSVLLAWEAAVDCAQGRRINVWGMPNVPGPWRYCEDTAPGAARRWADTLDAEEGEAE